MRILFVRHGKSLANANGTIGLTETSLAEEGIEQARATAQDLKGQGVTAIVCSPFIRAQQTAEIIAGELGIAVGNIHIINDLRERGLGELEGEPKRHESDYFYSNDTENGFEPRQVLITRMLRALNEIKTIARQTEGTTVAVGHATSGFYLLQVAQGKKHFEDFDPVSQMGNAEFIEVENKE